MRPCSLLLLLAACAPADGVPTHDAPAFSGEVVLGEADTGAEESGRLDMDGDGYVEGDCAETDPAIHPGAVELCNGIDDDCDGRIDADAADARTWFADRDDDGYGDEGTTQLACWAPADHTLLGGDCDDSTAVVHPGAAEVCDGVDDNCTGTEADAADAVVAYEDRDGDGYGFLPRTTCDPTGLVWVDGDCDDGAAGSCPGADEWCDGEDNDCDGAVDDDALDALPFYEDADGDSFGNASVPTYACAAAIGTVADDRDCDDADAGTGGPIAWFTDADGDGYGSVATLACVESGTTVALGGDCNDADATVWPGAPEACDALADLDCDGLVGTDDTDADGRLACDDCDDADATVAGPGSWYADRDGDGWGDAGQSLLACAAPTGFLADDTDCNDASSVAWPGAPEVWYDDEDEDCAGGDDWDQDLDGYAAPVADCLDTDAAVNPAGTEVCGNHLDDDCDRTDNGCAWTGTQSLGSADGVVRGTAFRQEMGTSWASAADYFGPGDPLIAVSDNLNLNTGTVYLAPLSEFLRDDGASPSWTATWEGEGPADRAGQALAGPGDFDADGTLDLVVGAPYDGNGTVYLIPLSSTGTSSLASATTRLPARSTSWYFGLVLAAVDDLDGDGGDELVVSDPYGGYDSADSGRGCAWFYTSPLPSAATMYAGRLCGEQKEQFWGWQMDVVDLVGDGLPELLLMSWNAEGEERGSGRVAFLELPFSGDIETDAVDFSLGGVSGADPIDGAGGVGDLDGDGYDEVYTGHASTAEFAYQAGSVHVYSGPLDASLNTDDATTTIYGTAENVLFHQAAAAGDLNGDGAADLLVSAPAGNVPGLSGQLGVFYELVPGTRFLDDADLLLEGEGPNEYAGSGYLGPGDLDGDGYGDLLIGASGWGGRNEGSAYVWLGKGG